MSEISAAERLTRYRAAQPAPAKLKSEKIKPEVLKLTPAQEQYFASLPPLQRLNAYRALQDSLRRFPPSTTP